jgi:hypothetical protein
MRTIRDESLMHPLLGHLTGLILHVPIAIIATSEEPTMNQEPRGRFSLEILGKSIRASQGA